MWALSACTLFGGGDTEDTWDTWETDGDTDADADGDSDADADADGDADADVDVVVAWDEEGVTLTISNGIGDYDFGMAETGNGAGGWYGEDCVDGDAGYIYCHGASSSGVSLTSVTEPFDVIPGQSTLFDENQKTQITYIVTDQLGDCWTWGENTGYYADQDCTEISQ